VDLAIDYQILESLELRLSAKNVLDEEPPMTTTRNVSPSVTIRSVACTICIYKPSSEKGKR